MRDTVGTSQASYVRHKQGLLVDAFSSKTAYDSTSSRRKEIAKPVVYLLLKTWFLCIQSQRRTSRKWFGCLTDAASYHLDLNHVAIPGLDNKCKMRVDGELGEIDCCGPAEQVSNVHFITKIFELKNILYIVSISGI